MFVSQRVFLSSNVNANSVRRLMATAMLVIGASSIAGAQTTSGAVDLPPVPPDLAVAAGHVAFLKGYAVGTQNYICLSTSSGVMWRFLGPQATLFHAVSDDAVRQLTTHFLSANPGEHGLARPTWQHSLDSSRVWGRVAASSTDPNFVEQGAIPWLLVEVVGTELGPYGGSRLAQTTYIQRLNTSGGIAPAPGCGQAADVGSIVLVPYTTDYIFYRASQSR
jgi:hypothetical protein